MDSLFQSICHRLPDRCLPGIEFLCGRCLGLYLGAAIGGFAVLATRLARRGIGGTPAAVALVVAVLATPAEVLGEKLGVWSGSPPLRFGLALALGTSLVFLMAGHRPGGRAVWLAPAAFLDAALLAGILLTEHWGGMAILAAHTLAAAGLLTLALAIGYVVLRSLRSSG